MSVSEEGGWEGGGGGGGRGADTELKTKTPHVNVGNKNPTRQCGEKSFLECELTGQNGSHAAARSV